MWLLRLARDFSAGHCRKRITELDGLRGVLAWFVVLVHIVICCGWFGPQWRGNSVLSEIAESALNIYILLSGFAITRLLLIKRESYKLYMRRRVCRIVPAYWVALALAVALNGWLADNLRRLPQTPDVVGLVTICNVAAQRFWIDVLLHVFLIHGLAPVQLLPFASLTFLGSAWSLSLEEQFYFAAPILLGLALRSRLAFGIIVAGGAAGLAFSDHWLRYFTVAFLPIKGGFILAGALTFIIAHRFDRDRKWPWLLALPALAAAVLWGFGSTRWLEAAITATVWLTIVAAGIGGRFSLVRSFLNSRPLQYLGAVSYSTYLFHAPVITFVQHAIWRWIEPPHLLALFGWTLAGSIAATAIVSHISWKWIEQPFQRLGRGQADPWRVFRRSPLSASR